MECSISEYFHNSAGPEGHRCGYCKSSDTSVSQGMWAHRLTVDDYQDLIDRGWRRSGLYCYKPLMSTTCCPLYTISCNATKFRMSKSQRRCANAMSKYLTLGEGPSSSSSEKHGAKVAGTPEKGEKVYTVSDKKKSVMPGDGPSSSSSDQQGGGKNIDTDSGKKKSVRPGEGADPSKPPCRKAKFMRLERKAKKAGSVINTIADAVTKMTESTNVSSVPRKDESVSCANAADAEPGVETKSGDAKCRLDKAAGEDESLKDSMPEFLKVGKDGKKPVEIFLQIPESTTKPLAHKLEIRLVRSSPPSAEFKATFREAYALFKKYQMFVHKEKEEDCKESGYRRFLCDSPLISKKGQDGWSCDYGSYHQHYRIDGKLVAVGVVDILPKCVSSVYVFIDMDYSFLSLGVYSALREVEMTRRLHLGDPESFKYYYMGYYVHSCQKMRYKGNYYPSYLLCPESYVFVPIESCRPKLEGAKYSRLCELDKPLESVRDWLGDTKVLADKTIYTFGILSLVMPKAKKEEEKVKEYSRLIGPKVARRMLLHLNL